jgi:hypothetical protein
MRQSFSRTTNYVFKDGRAEVIASRGILVTDPLAAASSFNVQAMLHLGVKRPVGHICISFHPDDTPMLTNNLMVELCEAWMKDMGISDTQYLLVRHYDTKHSHMHLVFNRIDDYGKLISDKMWYVRNERVCKDIKHRYGLTFSPGKQNVNVKHLRANDRRKYQMYQDVIKARNQAKSFSDFQFRLMDMGISFIIRKSSSNNDVLGVTFSRNGYSIKGSKLDRNLGIFKILKHFNQTANSERQDTGKRYVQVPMVEQESRAKSQDESKVKELASGLFEGNLDKSQEQDMKDPPKKKRGLKR